MFIFFYCSCIFFLTFRNSEKYIDTSRQYIADIKSVQIALIFYTDGK